MKSNKSKLSKTDKRLETLAAKTEKEKIALIVQLRKTPIVQIACERARIGRSTYYKWRTNDTAFARVADKAIAFGVFFVNDLAESQILRMIQDGNLTAVIFWLKYRHPSFSKRIIHEYDERCSVRSIEEKHIDTAVMADLYARKLQGRDTAEARKQDDRSEDILEIIEEPIRKKMKIYEGEEGLD
ncbi:MAG: hypothetical protein HY430_00685 [Candidatus Levybacteria bacterium]|nr:hypothetical protein [Candidatus Levybacteria bacterium]